MMLCDEDPANCPTQKMVEIGGKKTMSSPECSFVKTIISCVATACPKNLERDKMNMEWCPVKKEEQKSEHTTCGRKVSLSLDSKRRTKDRHQRGRSAGGAGEVDWLVPMVEDHVAR